ncbi:type IV pili methyl-accepting chemotaxis transducer N-terminal domain-containing protein [Pseudothauera nasutitermitis]|uniref:type IV pili methyl-accepting chemotaxis transducer N-terminal domain-containing protein n=1 Tax=Pseudothauera nasutitermitis TaxID=2565930 RepID=UPI001454D0D4|nr:type IV pili methyl-accepting chemotaxis transducer N-terminal domain-containing protein [Pseudothauera nasutitermitis]
MTVPAHPSHVASPAASGPAPHSFWQRYRVIIVAVTLFIVIDLGVLMLNFYTSFKIAEDAVSVNLSGRQRMLSQRMTKALLTLELERRDGRDTGPAREELRSVVDLFDRTLHGFNTGATVPGGDGNPVYLTAVADDGGRKVVADALARWAPYRLALAPVLEGRASPSQLGIAVAYARNENLRMLELMNDLTSVLEVNATRRADFLRMVQSVGILLALLNFIYILYKFLSSLRRADQATEAVNEENREILDSVREGLFLLHPDFTLGTQISRSVGTLLGRAPRPGDRLPDLLGPLLFEKDLKDARDYMELLFSPHVLENLVHSINPLSCVEVKTLNALGKEERKFLSFSFNRVLDDGRVRHLLVTMQDITARVALEQQIDAERGRARQEFSSLVQALGADTGALRHFVARAETQLLQVNSLLRSLSEQAGTAEVRKTLEKVFRLVHTFKGEAAALHLDLLADMAHNFEDELQQLHNKDRLNGDSLIQLPLQLEGLLEKIAVFKQIPLNPGTSDDPAQTADHALARALQLASRAAADLGKQVHTRLVFEDGALEHPWAQDPELGSLVIQLARNAIAHGIETPAERSAAGKPEAGLLTLTLARRASGELEIHLRDDGRGLQPAAVRQRLLDLGWYPPAELDRLSDLQILGQITKPGFSTAEPGGIHAGRGVGLDAVLQEVVRLGGRLWARSSPGRGSTFGIVLPGESRREPARTPA